jgi:hypothetical protein
MNFRLPSLQEIKSRLTFRRVATALIAVAAIGMAYTLVFAWPAQRAASRYSNRLFGSKAAGWRLNFEFKGQDFLQLYNSDLNLTGRFVRPMPDQFEAEGAWRGQFFGKSYEGEGTISDGIMHFNLRGSDLPVIRFKQTELLYHMEPQWYQTKLDHSAFDYMCAGRQDSKAPSPAALYRLVRSLDVQPSPFINPWSNIDGHKAIYQQGKIGNRSLPGLLEALNAQLPEGCPLSFAPEQALEWKVGYRLWNGQYQDRFRLTITDESLGSVTDLQLDTFDYDGDFRDIVPPPSTDLHRLLRERLGE